MRRYCRTAIDNLVRQDNVGSGDRYKLKLRVVKEKETCVRERYVENILHENYRQMGNKLDKIRAFA